MTSFDSRSTGFRHTVGTQLAERGAKLHTIMKVLGHSSVSEALVHAQVTDREVLRDYKSVLDPGPAAEELKSGTPPAARRSPQPGRRAPVLSRLT
ncbi:tyrosine-type recombinase/integrase [Nonomuraea sp. NPDC003707]